MRELRRLTPTPAAFPHDSDGERYQRTILVDGKPFPTTEQLFWAGISTLVGLPATVAPIGLTASGLPVGVQIIGGMGREAQLLRAAAAIERSRPLHLRRPPLLG